MGILWFPIGSYRFHMGPLLLVCLVLQGLGKRDLFRLCVSVCDVLLCMCGCVCVIVCVHV